MAQYNEDSQDNLKPVKDAQVPTITKKTFLITIIIALVILSTVWIWKSLEIKNLKKDAENENLALRQKSSQTLLLAHEEHLKLLAKPFVWAVRSEMMQGNLSQVNLYMNEMVKEKNFQGISLIDAKGKIVSSTDKKNEGQAFASIGNISDLSNNDTRVTTQDSLVSIVSPVMGFNNRLGTLVMKYRISGLEMPEAIPE